MVENQTPENIIKKMIFICVYVLIRIGKVSGYIKVSFKNFIDSFAHYIYLLTSVCLPACLSRCFQLQVTEHPIKRDLMGLHLLLIKLGG